MGFFEFIFTKLATLQKKHYVSMLVLFFIFTLLVGSGIKDLEFEGDISKEMPQQLPIYQLNNRISDVFGGQDMIIILIELDEQTESPNTPQDIRDPIIMNFVSDLDYRLNKESSIDTVFSVNQILDIGKMIHKTDELSAKQIIETFETFPQSDKLISKNKKVTMVMVLSEVGTDEDQVKSIENLIQNKIDETSIPPGLQIQITGSPSLISTVISMLKSDAVLTLIISSIIIIILLTIMQKSFLKAMLIFTPILLGLILTMGTMGWIGLKISMATAGLGAMILGLGVEYGIFMLSRYYEERENGESQENSLLIAVPAVGGSVTGSGSTTIIGFLALTLSIMPMMQHLGMSLALGIFYCIISTLYVEPILLLLYENYEFWAVKKNKHKFAKKRDKHKKLGK